MLIVVSGTHASGKSSLVEAFAGAHPEYDVLPDPFEAGSFTQQLEHSAARLLGIQGHPTIAERGPLDFLAYLDALEQLGRPTRSPEDFRRGVARCAEAMRGVDLVVLLGLDPAEPIDVPDDEDPELRLAMDASLLELSDDEELTGPATVLEVGGPPAVRLARLEQAVAALAVSPQGGATSP